MIGADRVIMVIFSNGATVGFFALLAISCAVAIATVGILYLLRGGFTT